MKVFTTSWKHLSHFKTPLSYSEPIKFLPNGHLSGPLKGFSAGFRLYEAPVNSRASFSFQSNRTFDASKGSFSLVRPLSFTSTKLAAGLTSKTSSSALIQIRTSVINTYNNSNKSSRWTPWYRSWRLFGPLSDRINELDPNVIVMVLIGLNVAVFGLWNTYGQSREGRQYMFENFSVSLRNLQEGRVWTLITSCFSQISAGHLLGNMLALYFIGTRLTLILGNTRFIWAYLMGGITSSVGHIWYENYWKAKPLMRRRETPALGASGSVMTMAVLYGLIWPFDTIYLYFLFPVPAIALATGYVAWDFYSAYTESQSGVAHAGHLGGAVFGALYMAYLRFVRGRVG
eukprot:TRINITY_DN4724_c0_g1_i1.p1 TRINITY_DN4724_c0_g1~~TRINITY_DN4724_c0_g1_i1.p1  ORF type:complete len:344 (-),score=24.38 TRINITY_DN4724_c0_g1_i1:54-1085(-)